MVNVDKNKIAISKLSVPKELTESYWKEDIIIYSLLQHYKMTVEIVEIESTFKQAARNVLLRTLMHESPVATINTATT